MCLVDIVYFLWISPVRLARIFHLWRTIGLVQPKMPEASVKYTTTIESMAIRKIEIFRVWSKERDEVTFMPDILIMYITALYQQKSVNDCAVGLNVRSASGRFDVRIPTPQT